MQRIRLRVLALVALGTALLGSLAFTVGSACHLRSDAYRLSCAESLSRELGLPSEIGRVLPRSRKAMEFRDIVVWLPEKRARAHTCREALFRYVPEPGDPDAYELILAHGTCEVSTRTWLRSDYRDVIGRGLRPGFSPSGPKRVHFSEMGLSFERDGFRITLEKAAGNVTFSPTLGKVHVLCESINGHPCSEPAVLTAAFSPVDSGFQVDDLSLIAPELPIQVVGLKQLAGIDARSGSFRGRLDYREFEQTRRLTLSGRCTDLSLAEFTAGLLPRSIKGRCSEIELNELVVENRVPTRLRFHGVASEVAIGDIAALVGLSGVASAADLDIREAELTQAGIARFSAAGKCEDLPLEALSSLLNKGMIAGKLRVRLTDLTIRDNHIASLKASVESPPASRGEPRWIEGRVLRELASQFLKFELPPILPEKIEYKELGARLEIVDERLYVYGTHGEGEKTILTIRILGRDVALIREPSQAFELGPWLNDLRARMDAEIRDHLKPLDAR